MEEKAEKMLCVLRKHIHDVTFQFGFYKYYDHNKEITINLSKDYNRIPEVTEPKYKWGIKVGTRVIKESYTEYFAKIATWRNGKNYQYIIPIEEYDKFKQDLDKAVEEKLFKDLNKMCHEQEK